MSRLLKYVSENAVRRLIKFDGPCCISCHDDAEEYEGTGLYQLMELEFSKDRWSEVCCSVRNEYDAWIRRRAGMEEG
jgi:hypothetical protein